MGQKQGLIKEEDIAFHFDRLFDQIDENCKNDPSFAGEMVDRKAAKGWRHAIEVEKKKDVVEPSSITMSCRMMLPEPEMTTRRKKMVMVVIWY